MGKKVKRQARSSQKEKQSRASSKTVATQPASNAETPDNGVARVVDGGVCSHIDRGINLKKLSAKTWSPESLRCEDCQAHIMDRQSNKKKSKQGKKSGNSKSKTKPIWICLECGHFSCGGVGLPNTPQSHAVRHAKQNHHPLVVHYENQNLVWCFPCSKLISAENCGDTKEHKDVLHDVGKLLKGRTRTGSSVDVEDVWFGSGSVREMEQDNSVSTNASQRTGYLVRGLVNLGNTCFFNSIVQNLLAIDRLRNYFLKLDESLGPLSASLKKLFTETSAEAGLRGVINPRSLFGSVCTKAPQFRGYDQHDSHELLRCLTDGLSTEELSARKRDRSSQTDGTVSVANPTFVDTIFGGKLSSTVTCLECGHSSTIYEPFLDLSLPVPNKKPPSKKAQTAPRGKNSKLQSKKTGKFRPKISRDSHSVPAKSSPSESTGGYSASEVQSRVKHAEQKEVPSDDSSLSNPVTSNALALEIGIPQQDLSTIPSPEKQSFEKVELQPTLSDNFAWLDYLDQTPVSNDFNIASDADEVLVSQVSASGGVLPNGGSFSLPSVSDSRNAACETSSDSAEQFNSPEQDKLTEQLAVLQCESKKADAHIENEQTTFSCIDGQLTPECSLTEELVQSNAKQVPLCFPDSEVLLLPDKADVSSNVEASNRNVEVPSGVTADEQDSLSFDGFADLFNEPETTSELRNPEIHAKEAGDTVKTDIVGTSGDSDPDEVDHTNNPVSVESCLNLFTKPEHLSRDDHAWECDSCSKVLHEKMIRSRRTLQKGELKILPNGCESRSSSVLLHVGRNSHDIGINGKVEEDRVDLQSNVAEDTVSASHGRLLPQTLESYDIANGMSQDHHASEKKDITYPSETEGFKINSTDKIESESSEEEANTENVKVKRDATKRMLVNKCPSILTIHLKRFFQDARGRLSKLNGHVNFRESIDLKPYMDSRCTERDTYTYRLVGVVEHLGSMRGGHYVAYVRGVAGDGRSAWYHASDAHVREVSLEEVLRCEAYILFYEET